MAQLLQVRRVAKGYRRSVLSAPHKVLASIDLSLRRGEVAGLYGSNGSGKTTLTRLLVGLTNQDDGDIQVLGLPPSKALKAGLIGYVPERERLPGYMTPTSMLRVRRRGTPRSIDQDWVDFLHETLGLEGLMHRPVRELSKGQRQRISILLAIAPLPPLIIMDEPTDGLDPVSRVKVRDIIRALSQRNVGVLMNSHLVDETQSACESYAILHGGTIKERGRSESLRTQVSSWMIALSADAADLQKARQTLHLPDADERGFMKAPASNLEELNAFIEQARSHRLLLSALEPERHPIEDKLAAFSAGESKQ